LNSVSCFSLNCPGPQSCLYLLCSWDDRHTQSHSALLVEMASNLSLWLVLSQDPPCLCLPSSWNYSCEPLHPVKFSFFSLAHNTIWDMVPQSCTPFPTTFPSCSLYLLYNWNRPKKEEKRLIGFSWSHAQFSKSEWDLSIETNLTPWFLYLFSVTWRTLWILTVQLLS
jgi:hypothetical protein